MSLWTSHCGDANCRCTSRFIGACLDSLRPDDGAQDRLWRFVNWRRHDYTAATRHGFRMRGRSNDLVQGYAYYFGVWEPSLTAWLERRFLSMQDEVFVDVGANVGYYSLLAHKRMAYSCNVVAIEAMSPIHAMLEENIRLNRFDRIRAVNCAATAAAGTLTLYPADEKNLGATTVTEGIWASEGVTVAAEPLAGILSADEIARTRIVKIDVEGAELGVLRGLWPILDRLRKDIEFVVEINEDTQEILTMFREAGFNAYALTNVYSYKHYMQRQPARPPQRMREVPEGHFDVVFSRVDAEEL